MNRRLGHRCVFRQYTWRCLKDGNLQAKEGSQKTNPAYYFKCLAFGSVRKQVWGVEASSLWYFVLVALAQKHTCCGYVPWYLGSYSERLSFLFWIPLTFWVYDDLLLFFFFTTLYFFIYAKLKKQAQANDIIWLYILNTVFKVLHWKTELWYLCDPSRAGNCIQYGKAGSR